MLKFLLTGSVLLKPTFKFIFWMFSFISFVSLSFKFKVENDCLINFEDLCAFLGSITFDTLADVFSFVKKQLFFCWGSGFSFSCLFPANNIEYEHSYLFSYKISSLDEYFVLLKVLKNW